MDNKLFDAAAENLMNEIIYGVIILGVIGLCWRYARDYLKAWWIFRRVIRIHNSPTRAWPIGLCFMDRFMELYENKDPMRSAGERVQPYAIWPNVVVDEVVLSFHGLVQINDASNGKTATVIRNRVTKLLYKRCQRKTIRDKKRCDSFIQDETRRKKV